VIQGRKSTSRSIRASCARIDSAEVDVTFLRFPGFDHTFSPPTGREDTIVPEFLEPTLEFIDRSLGT